MPWPVPPSEATTRLFAALSPERLESERLESESPASPERPRSPELLTASRGAGERGLPGQDGDDRAKQPRRMRRLALVSGLSVLLAVGVTTGGARLIAGRTSLTMEQPTTACPISENCAAAGGPYGASGSGQALGETPAQGDPTGAPTGDPVVNDQDQPSREDSGTSGSEAEDTGRDGSAAPRATPASTADSKGRDRDHTSARTRTPSTAAPRASAHGSPQVDDAPAAVTAAPDDTTGTASDEGATPGETPLDDPRNNEQAGNNENAGNSENAGNAEDAADEADAGANRTTGGRTARTRSALAAGGPAVGVRFTVTDRDEGGYTARIAVRNEGPALSAWTVRLAVGGQVTAVEGAGWRQQGDTLTLTSQTALDEDGTLTLTVHAEGASAAPADCVLSEGRCEVTGPSRRD
ncbi:hypothetical protein ACIBK1_22815 [Microbispora rosea]|uniref:hypothetical protein n=1 Tax=Microbispora rosea TaxID=58117 RepID=UPI00379DC61D